jgi:hypothetical protein
LFSSCKWIFNYTYITVHKSMSKLLCNSLWNWSWGNAYIHLLVEGIPASILAESLLWIICTLTPYLPFLSCLWNWHSVFWYVIYHDTSLVWCRIWPFWLETEVFVVVAFLLKYCSILWSIIGYTCLIWSDLCMFVNRNKKFSIRLECNEN